MSEFESVIAHIVINLKSADVTHEKSEHSLKIILTS